ncbi:leucine-rich repeat domain-containing protein [Capnocytophaga sp. G2]|uniref:leucine-rich repeat domain-containing protein n=1 Tax=Capnocytophaga sp. G2 TaxID=3110695 RepID=UPI002B49B0AF|nr:leucine-rich repeat domain-containing protein [Capnocytophaga sp. G2]MEB3005852.1 leucine-rich repeat domain-containing protein [Capnocytophaga sp. G2]
MKRYLHRVTIVLLVVILMTLGACKKDDISLYGKAFPLDNPELTTALKAKGFSFEGNAIVIDDKLWNLTSLDLSGAGLKSVAGITIFKNLQEVNLSNNALGKVFDFSLLPENIQQVDLSGNSIYEFKNFRPLRKLILPVTAQYDMESLPAYSKTAAKADIQIATKDGSLKKYTTLREVPDPTLLELFKRLFPSLMIGDKIDISKPLRTAELSTPIVIEQSHHDPTGLEIDKSKIMKLDGLEYIINHPHYAGNVQIEMSKEKEATLPYLKIRQYTEGVSLKWVNTPALDLSQAENLKILMLSHNKAIKQIDLSHSKVFLQRGEKSIFSGLFGGDILHLGDCPALEKVTLPELSKGKKPIGVYAISLIALPKLQDFDMSKLQVINTLTLSALPIAKITYPTQIAYFTNNGERDDENGELNFAITQEIYERAETKAFIQKYNGKITPDRGELNEYDLENYDWVRAQENQDEN